MRSKCEPDNSARPLTMTVERLMKADASDIYQAWTQKFDSWFAQVTSPAVVYEASSRQAVNWIIERQPTNEPVGCR